MRRVACGGGSRGRFGVRVTKGVWSVEWRLFECESGKCESEKCGACRGGFSNFCFHSLISFSLIRYLLSLIIVN